tara:strand:- start:908 stop:1432 length:525 start_codon:yes stop_codon:yes gene_type:complete
VSNVKAIFSHFDGLIDAIADLKSEGYTDFAVTAPLPRHEIEEVIYEGEPSPVRWFTLAGAVFGGIFGFTLCSITHLNWPMIIPAGKPLVSIPAFIVITFESTVLWGCMFTLIGLLYHCRLPAKDMDPELEDPRLSDDVFGMVVRNLDHATANEIKSKLDGHGAIETSITGVGLA